MDAENWRGTTLVLGGAGKAGGRVAGHPVYALGCHHRRVGPPGAGRFFG